MDSLPREHSAPKGSLRTSAVPECSAELQDFALAEAANDTRMSQLARTIELEIIPRLMLAHRAAPLDAARRTEVEVGRPITSDEMSAFAKQVLSLDEDDAMASVDALRARHVPVEQIYLDLLAPTARYLGELWEEDLCSFTDVTVGLGRLQRVLRALSAELGASVDHPPGGRRILLMPSPGEQHTFGLIMVAEFFRRAGWSVTGGAWLDGSDAATLVRDEWFDAIGFSLGAEVHLSALADRICAVRRAACNQGLAVLVGGPIFGLHPEFADQVGADGMTIDGREAPSLAESLIAGKTCRHGPPA